MNLKFKLHLLVVFLSTIIMSSCNSELDNELALRNDGGSSTMRPSGKYGVFAQGGTQVGNVLSRAENGLPGSSASVIQYTGGRLKGCGWYAQKEVPIIYANPDPGYEVEYCYGSRVSKPDYREYDYARRGNGIRVPIEDDDIIFHCKFRAIPKGTIELKQSPGGKAMLFRNPYMPSQYRIEVTPDRDYVFTGWTIEEGDARIEDSRKTHTYISKGNRRSIVRPNFVRAVLIKIQPAKTYSGKPPHDIFRKPPQRSSNARFWLYSWNKYNYVEEVSMEMVSSERLPFVATFEIYEGTTPSIGNIMFSINTAQDCAMYAARGASTLENNRMTDYETIIHHGMFYRLRLDTDLMFNYEGRLYGPHDIDTISIPIEYRGKYYKVVYEGVPTSTIFNPAGKELYVITV